MNNKHKNEIELPPKDYQPSKSELEREFDMPGVSDETLRSTIFNAEIVRKPKPDRD